MTIPIRGLLVATAVLVTPACLCDSELCRAGGGAGSIAIGGGAASAPSTPMAPPLDLVQEPDPYAEYEQHGAVSPDACLTMLDRFLAEGRRVRFVEAVPNPYNEGGGVLEWLCLFDGEDASPEATPFEDDRFPKGEYDFP